MSFITLTTSTGKKIYVNANAIAAVEQADEDALVGTVSVVIFDEGFAYYVQEDIDEVVNRALYEHIT